jgi:hypothetical protein
MRDIDTIIVPARRFSFRDIFLGENRWYAIRLGEKRIPLLKYIAVYQVGPISAITHFAKIESIKKWKYSGRYVINFGGDAIEIGPIKLTPGGKTRSFQNTRFTTSKRLFESKDLDEVFR